VLNKCVAAGERGKREFLEKAEKNLCFALEGADGPAETHVLGAACAQLLEYTKEPENFPLLVQHVHNEYSRQLIQDRHRGASTSHFTNAMEHTRRAAYSRLVALLKTYCLPVYKNHNVPTTEEETS